MPSSAVPTADQATEVPRANRVDPPTARPLKLRRSPEAHTSAASGLLRVAGDAGRGRAGWTSRT